MADRPSDASTTTAELRSRLTRLREAWARGGYDQQQQRRRRQDDCPHDGGTTRYATITASGAIQDWDGCTLCQKPDDPGRWLPHDPDTTATVVEDRRTINPPCAVCGDWGTELHHWAPRSVYGPEADHWPTSYLCVACHTDWHKRISDA